MKTNKLPNIKISAIIILLLSLQSSQDIVIAQTNRKTGINPVMKVTNLNKNTENLMPLDNKKDVIDVGKFSWSSGSHKGI